MRIIPGEGVAPVETPDMFIRAADWAHGRDFGCPAGIALRRTLLELTGPPRLGACSLDGPVPLPAWPGVRPVSVSWPVVTTAVDAVLLIHPGPLTAVVRARIAAGPQAFLVLSDVPQLPPTLPLLDARVRLLAGELRTLARRFPDVAAELLAIAGPEQLPPRRPRIAVISPEPVDSLATDFPGLDIVDDPHVDAVVAVAPPGGWRPHDHPTLLDAATRAGRLVSTAPLPAGIPGTVAHPDRPLLDAVHHALRQPRTVPDTRPGGWLRAADVIARRRHREVIARLDHARPPSPWTHRDLLIQVLFITALTALTLSRLHPGLAVAAGLGAGGLRWWTGRREAVAAWRRAETARLTAEPTAQARWIRRQLAKES